MFTCSGGKRKTKQLAYSRRQKENDTFAEIARTLPVSAEGVKELDKASILRVAIHFIKLRQFMEQGLFCVRMWGGMCMCMCVYAYVHVCRVCVRVCHSVC